MPKTIFEGDHTALVRVLTEARQASGLRQVDVAAQIGRDQAFVSLIEKGQRRVDVIEFIRLSRALGHDPQELFSELVKRLNESNLC